ncbi:pheST operon leader peptide PheM [Shigella sonnei]|nr:pheST operon leader peptide PheM [Enterobacter hormaechei]EHD6817642.1 pheST operon leader peptide PheM [Salmonella enterica]ELV1358984.1 pheST operon leader peptide PheM [Escherichia coli]HBC0543025.1 pheST operon leader peptide PheM [Citrobacter freundii]HDG7938319.1 pheST operon leader peptide PheM [Klebsiella pneumoniae]HDX4638393.1 pheST operon leader peptide PheM [Enterobacter hormaechei subsp. steigerwaltii]
MNAAILRFFFYFST